MRSTVDISLCKYSNETSLKFIKLKRMLNLEIKFGILLSQQYNKHSKTHSLNANIRHRFFKILITKCDAA